MTTSPAGSKPPKTYTSDFPHAENAELRIEMQSIGVVHSAYKERFSAPRQASLGKALPARIILNTGMNFEQALADLDGFSYIWVHYCPDV